MRIEIISDALNENTGKVRICTDDVEIANHYINFCLCNHGIGVYIHPVSDDIPLNDYELKRLRELEDG